MSCASTKAGISSARLKPNWPSRRRMSCSSATSMRRRMSAARSSGGSSRDEGSTGGLSQVKDETTRPSLKTMAPSPAAVRMVR